MVPNHQRMSSAGFHAFAEEWLDCLEPAEIISVPGVAELLLEYYNNLIIKEIDETCWEDLEPYEDQGRENLENAGSPREDLTRKEDDG